MTSKRPSITTQLRNDQLEHVVVVAGKPIQTHSTLKAAMAALLLAMALTGCETCQEHPGACAVATGIAASCIALSADHGSNRAHDVATPSVVCANGSCK